MSTDRTTLKRATAAANVRPFTDRIATASLQVWVSVVVAAMLRWGAIPRSRGSVPLRSEVARCMPKPSRE